MDFMKWINSLDELLYEVMSWLLFFPLTLWRSLARPLAMMAYADEQLALPEPEQYAAALSPPLFLTLSLLIAHGVAVALGQSDAIVAARQGLGGLVDDDASALVLRLVVFASFALFAAARLVRRLGLPIDRASLRMPFYAQCYPTAVFALSLGLGASLAGVADPAVRVGGRLLAAAGMAHYAIVEMRWFALKLGTGYVRAAGAVLFGLFEGLALLLFVGFLFTR